MSPCPLRDPACMCMLSHLIEPFRDGTNLNQPHKLVPESCHNTVTTPPSFSFVVNDSWHLGVEFFFLVCTCSEKVLPSR